MGHRTLRRSDPRFWGESESSPCSLADEEPDYNIRELALYDLPAVIAHVKRETAYDKVALFLLLCGSTEQLCR